MRLIDADEFIQSLSYTPWFAILLPVMKQPEIIREINAWVDKHTVTQEELANIAKSETTKAIFQHLEKQIAEIWDFLKKEHPYSFGRRYGQPPIIPSSKKEESGNE